MLSLFLNFNSENMDKTHPDIQESLERTCPNPKIVGIIGSFWKVSRLIAPHLVMNPFPPTL